MDNTPLRRIHFVKPCLIDGKQQKAHYWSTTNIQKQPKTISSRVSRIKHGDPNIIKQQESSNSKTISSRVSRIKHGDPNIIKQQESSNSMKKEHRESTIEYKYNRLIITRNSVKANNRPRHRLNFAGSVLSVASVESPEPSRKKNSKLFKQKRSLSLVAERISPDDEIGSDDEADQKTPLPARKRKPETETKWKKQLPSGTTSTCDYFGDGVNLATKDCPTCVDLCAKCDVYRHLPHHMGMHKRGVFVKARDTVHRMKKEEHKAEEEVHGLSDRLACVNEKLQLLKQSFADSTLIIR